MENSVREKIENWFEVRPRDSGWCSGIHSAVELDKFLKDLGILLIPASDEKTHSVNDQCSFLQELLAELEGLVRTWTLDAPRFTYCADQLQKLIKKHK